MREARGRLLPWVGLVVLVLLSSCGTTPPPPTTSPAPQRPFTVGTTDRITTTDPAAITDQASGVIATNVFQRLLTTDNGSPQPDAARDCKVDAPQVYLCTLNEDLVFSNGNPLTSSDVKFSLERALRLAVPDSSASQLSSIRKIETPDDLTVRIFLNRVDTQFGFALASPAASIVDEEVYDPDQVRTVTDPVFGSGPLQVTFYSSEELQLSRNPTYQGFHAAGLATMTLKSFPTSAALETAMAEHRVDVVWRGLSDAAQSRYANQVATSPGQTTADGYRRVVLPGARTQELWWRPGSPYRGAGDLRATVSTALQEDRVADSLVPVGVEGHTSAFEVGPATGRRPAGGERIALTLAYDPTSPNAADLANTLRGRLEDTGQMSVRLVRSTPSTAAPADLAVVDRKAWTSTPLAWLQPYLDDPVQTTKVRQTENVARAAGLGDDRGPEAIDELQRLAAADLVILPITQTDEYVYLDAGIRWSADSLAPGGQLALWAFSKE